MKKYLMIVGLFLISHLTFAQQDLSLKINDEGFKKYDSIRPLKIGDKVPEVFFNSFLNIDKKTAKLSDFKGRYVILDFWNIWCSSCISAFPKMQQLQEKFQNDISIILVTNNTPDQVHKLQKRSPILKNITLPIIMSDTMLNNVLFPHKGVPFHIWLDRNGIVKAATNGYSTNVKNIENLIANKPLEASMIEDADEIQYQEITNGKTSLLKTNNSAFVNNLLFFTSKSELKNTSPYYSLFTSRLENFRVLPSNIQLEDSTGKYIGLRIFNMPILHLFWMAYTSALPTDSTKNLKRKVFTAKDVQFESEPDIRDQAYREWWEKTSLCYEAVIPNYNKDNIYTALQQDLRRFTGVIGKIEEKALPCLVLIRTTKNDMLHYSKKGDPFIIENTQTSSGYVFNNAPFTALESFLTDANNTVTSPIIINETGIPSNTKVNMNLKVNNLKDSEALRKELARYGLGLKKEVRKLNVLVLKREK